jgi:hypothetical protein
LAVLHDQFAGRAPGFRGGFSHMVTINVARDKPCIDPVVRPFAMRPSEKHFVCRFAGQAAHQTPPNADMSRPSGAVPGQVWVAAGRRTIDRNSFDASAVIGDRVAALVVRDAQAFVPMIPPPLFVGKSSPLDPPHPAHRASFLERTTLSN